MQYGATALLKASSQGHHEVVSRLLKFPGINVNHADKVTLLASSSTYCQAMVLPSYTCMTSAVFRQFQCVMMGIVDTGRNKKGFFSQTGQVKNHVNMFCMQGWPSSSISRHGVHKE
jgi:hypothetical protein